jgi:hypothetical protein
MGYEAESAGREHLANASMIGQSIGNPQAVIQSPEFKQLLSTLPPDSQTKLLSAPPKDIAAILTAAHGDADAKSLFPQRVYAKAGQLSYEDAVGYIKAANPGWTAELAPTVQKLQNDFTVGTQGQAIRSFNQFFSHAAELKDVSDQLVRTNSPLLNMPLNKITDKMLGKAGVPELKTALAAARDEWQTFIKSGKAMDKQESDANSTIMNDKSNLGQIAGVLGVMGTQAVGRLDPINEEWRTVRGTDYPNLITPRGRDAINKLGLANQIQQYKTGGTLQGVMAPSAGGQGAAPTPQNVSPQNANPQTGQAPPTSALKEGVMTKFANGQTWTLQKGVANQLPQGQ